jgi:hypothetical protein
MAILIDHGHPHRPWPSSHQCTLSSSSSSCASSSSACLCAGQFGTVEDGRRYQFNLSSIAGVFFEQHSQQTSSMMMTPIIIIAVSSYYVSLAADIP